MNSHPARFQLFAKVCQGRRAVERPEAHQQVHIAGGPDVMAIDVGRDATDDGPGCASGVEQVADGPCGRPGMKVVYSFHSVRFLLHGRMNTLVRE